MPAAPSLLIVPYRSKTGKLYSQIPTSGAGDFTVTRDTTARRFNSAGLIESVASGIPRLDYYTSGGTAGCPALLVEPAGTNLAWHSETWAAGSNWNLSAGGTPRVTRVTGSTDAFKAPNGAFTANAISPTSGNVSHQFFSNAPTEITYTSGTIYTQSAFFKAGTGDAGRYVQLTFGSPQFTQVGYANFDLQVGAVVASGGLADANRNARIENYGNGWYRCAFTATCNASGTTNGVFAALITASGATRVPSFSGTVTDVLYGWGAQVEAGSVPTSYIPTTAGTGSRSADVISVTGAVSGSIGQTEGTLYVEFEIRSNSANRRLIALSDNTSTNSIFIWSLSNVLYAQIQAQTITIINPISDGRHKVALAYQQNGVSGSVFISLDGGAIVSGTSATYPSSLFAINVGKNEATNTSSLFFNDRIRAVALYTTRLTNAELATLTTP